MANSNVNAKTSYNKIEREVINGRTISRVYDDVPCWFNYSDENIQTYQYERETDTFKLIYTQPIGIFLAEVHNIGKTVFKSKETEEKYGEEWTSHQKDLYDDFPEVMSFFNKIGFDNGYFVYTPSINELLSAHFVISQGSHDTFADEAFGHNRSLDEIQQGTYGQAALENTPNLMTCRIDLTNDKFVLYYPGDSLTRMVLLSLHEMFIRELPLLKICPNCGKAFIAENRTDTVFCSAKCRRQQYRQLNPLRAKVDSRQNLIRREITAAQDSNDMEKVGKLQDAYDDWNARVDKILPERQQAIQHTIAALAWDKKPYEANKLPEAVSFSKEIKDIWEVCKHGAGIE